MPPPLLIAALRLRGSIFLLAAQRLTASGAELRLANGTTLLGKLNGELARRLNS
jgi:hypothetical protein